MRQALLGIGEVQNRLLQRVKILSRFHASILPGKQGLVTEIVRLSNRYGPQDRRASRSPGSAANLETFTIEKGMAKLAAD
jgi:hypothetical protein